MRKLWNIAWTHLVVIAAVACLLAAGVASEYALWWLMGAAPVVGLVLVALWVVFVASAAWGDRPSFHQKPRIAFDWAREARALVQIVVALVVVLVVFPAIVTAAWFGVLLLIRWPLVVGPVLIALWILWAALWPTRDQASCLPWH